ncbi:MAG: glycosyltransferase family 39 protein [Phycisphaeraceae bacterium]|nr:MAG: glycosyltransferase family 39 protein [Phycisphaeraceae bacterium]
MNGIVAASDADRGATGVRWWAIMLGAALAVVLVARVLGPSDVHHQTQPKTISYTTDMLVHGRWVLPLERGMLPATKPPLYNWVAAPFVRVMGFDSTLAHKMPSVLSLIACAAVVVCLGERVLGRGVGFLAATMLVATYAMYKLGYLARPDMLLTLWLTIAWLAATRVLVGCHQPSAVSREREGVRRQAPSVWDDALGAGSEAPGTRNPKLGTLAVLFWLAVALAWLTKGPPALAAMLFPFLIARPLAGRLGAVHCLRWWWGVPLSLLPFAAWVVAVYVTHPDHLVRTLWEDELYGRVMGTQGEAPEAGPLAWITTSLHMPAYFLLRAAPWSVLTILAVVLLWRRAKGGGGDGGHGNDRGRSAIRAWRAHGEHGAWLHAAATWVVLIVVLFSLSAGKRADYIAAAYPPAMLLAAWGWMQVTGPSDRIRRVIPSITAAGAMALLVLGGGLEWGAPVKGAGRAYESFIRDAKETLDAQPLPLVFTSTGGSHVQAFLGSSAPETAESLHAAFHRHERFWLIAGDRPRTAQREGFDVPSYASRRGARATLVRRSTELPRTPDWPGGFTLWRVDRNPGN